MAFVTDPIRKIQRVIPFAGKKAKADKTKPQDATANAMIINIRNIFYEFAALGKHRVINDKIFIFCGLLVKLQLAADFHDDPV